MNKRATEWFSPPVPLSRGSWPPDYVAVYAWRQQQLDRARRDPTLAAGAIEYYRTRPVEFICHWVDTFDPRKTRGLRRMPLVLFERQAEFVEFLHQLVTSEADGLVEKCRDVGATWLCAAFSVHQWLFVPGTAIGWGSRKADLVDKLGVMDSIFEKIRMIIRGLPPFFLPDGFSPKDNMTYMRVTNPENGNTIVGESGDDIGRGGRTTMYFKDESAHYERPDLIEAALGDNTRTQIDISSVNGLGNVFHRKREAGLDWMGTSVDNNRTNVFVFDWRDHPEKSQSWYDARRARAQAEGMMHVFAQEVDRNYSASVLGTLIPLEWIQASYDAHIKLDIDVGDRRVAGLDVGDTDVEGDRNALVVRRGILLESADEWGITDTGETTRRAVTQVGESCDLQYDCIGIGAGVKAEANRLAAENQLPRGLSFVAWSASASPLLPDDHLIADDEQSPKNRDFFMNLKAQGWWQLYLRFQRTYRWLTEGIRCNPDDCISISSQIPVHILRQLEKELAQVVKKQSTGTLKMVIDKTPKGTRSPNLGDATMMAYWPIPVDTYTLDNL